MARIYADNVVFLMRPGEAARRPAGRARAYRHTQAPRPSTPVETPPRVAPRRSPWLALLVVVACVLPPAVLAWRAVAHQPTPHAVAAATSDAAVCSPLAVRGHDRSGCVASIRR